jgi:type II secretory pathway component GspD/PulD (secretin)
MTALRPKLAAFAAVAMAAIVLAYGQERPERARGARRDRPAERARQRAPADVPQEARRRSPLQQSVPREGIPEAEIAVIPLKHADVREVIRVLVPMRPAFGQVIVCDFGDTDSVVVAADDKKAIEKVLHLVAELDKPPFSDRTRVCEAVRLKHIGAEEVCEYLQKLVPWREVRVQLAADEHANTVWVTGEQSQVAWVAEVARRIDENAADVGSPKVQAEPELEFYALAHARAELLAETLIQVGRAMNLDAVFVPDEPSSTLIVYATPGAQAQLRTIITALDVPPKHARKRPPSAQHKPPAPGQRGDK